MSSTAIAFVAHVSVSNNVRGKQNVGHKVSVFAKDGSLITERVYLNTISTLGAATKAISSRFPDFDSSFSLTYAEDENGIKVNEFVLTK